VQFRSLASASDGTSRSHGRLVARDGLCNYNVGVDALRFEWDAQKDALNQASHGISFDEAKTVFFDPRAIVIDDPDHSAAEDRFVILGLSRALRLLVVVHCHRAAKSTIRIITARKATRHESTSYRGGARHGR